MMSSAESVGRNTNKKENNMEQSLMLKLDEKVSIDGSKCRGLFFRCKENAFVSSYQSIEIRKSLTFLKKPSCSGCPICENTLEVLKEDLAEGYSDFADKAVSGNAYQLFSRWHPGSYENPDDGEYELYLIECPEIKKLY